MPTANDSSGRPESQRSEEDIDLELATEASPESAGDGHGIPLADGLEDGLGDSLATSTLRSRLAVVAGFLTLFHLVLAVIKLTGPESATASASDAPT